MFPGSYTDSASEADSTVRRVARIMVVDDEPDTVMTLLELLRSEGYEAEGFASGKSALDRLTAFDPDVVRNRRWRESKRCWLKDTPTWWTPI